MKVEETKMKMYVDERKLKIEVDDEIYKKIFNEDCDAVMLEVEMIVEGLEDVEKNVKFVKNDENYDVYLNNVKYEFDY